MMTDGLLLLESFFLPESREKLAIFFKNIDTKADKEVMKVLQTEAMVILQDQIKFVEEARKRKLNLDLKRMIIFLLSHRKTILHRLETILVRSKSVGG
jgi:hypothetical protein